MPGEQSEIKWSHTREEGVSLLGRYQQPREQKSDMGYNDPLFTQRSQRAGEWNAQSQAEHVPVTKQRWGLPPQYWCVYETLYQDWQRWPEVKKNQTSSCSRRLPINSVHCMTPPRDSISIVTLTFFMSHIVLGSIMSIYSGWSLLRPGLHWASLTG